MRFYSYLTRGRPALSLLYKLTLLVKAEMLGLQPQLSALNTLSLEKLAGIGLVRGGRLIIGFAGLFRLGGSTRCDKIQAFLVASFAPDIADRTNKSGSARGGIVGVAQSRQGQCHKETQYRFYHNIPIFERGVFLSKILTGWQASRHHGMAARHLMSVLTADKGCEAGKGC